MKRFVALIMAVLLLFTLAAATACGNDLPSPSDGADASEGNTDGNGGEDDGGAPSGGAEDGSGETSDETEDDSGEKEDDSGEKGDDSGEKEEDKVLPLTLSHESGAYAASFGLTVTPSDPSHKIYYTLDGSLPTAASAQLNGGYSIADVSATRVYPLTRSVTWTGNTHGGYTFGMNNGCTVLRLLETDASGAEVARKTATYFVRTGGEAYFTLPVISLVLPPEDAAFYNDVENESKTRAEMAYFDFVSGERFALNTQIKVGGNWTKGYPYRTMNVNFNKDENGNKNTPVTVALFGDRKARNGGTLTKFKRFRLHSGGNSQVLSWFGDAFAQTVAADCTASDGGSLQVATTGYRPCEVYLNGEYWGMYAIREHYSDVYFEQNYGVDKDEVLLVDRTTNVWTTDNTFNQKYSFELAEDNEAEDGSGMRKAVEFFDFLMATDFSDDENYRVLSQKVDLTGLADLVLTHFYAGNWDFMYNNIKMWRTDAVDPSNPYADGRWRFCLHDLDFSFESFFGDNAVQNANCFEFTENYLDYYLGRATYNGNPALSREVTCLLSAPMQNAQFRALLQERARKVQEVFEYSRARQILTRMEQEVDVPMQRHLVRWARTDGYNYDGTYNYNWKYFVRRTYDVLYYRTRVQWDGNEVYPNGDYFTRQVDATIRRYEQTL